MPKGDVTLTREEAWKITEILEAAYQADAYSHKIMDYILLMKRKLAGGVDEKPDPNFAWQTDPKTFFGVDKACDHNFPPECEEVRSRCLKCGQIKQ